MMSSALTMLFVFFPASTRIEVFPLLINELLPDEPENSEYASVIAFLFRTDRPYSEFTLLVILEGAFTPFKMLRFAQA